MKCDEINFLSPPDFIQIDIRRPLMSQHIPPNYMHKAVDMIYLTKHLNFGFKWLNSGGNLTTCVRWKSHLKSSQPCASVLFFFQSYVLWLNFAFSGLAVSAPQTCTAWSIDAGGRMLRHPMTPGPWTPPPPLDYLAFSCWKAWLCYVLWWCRGEGTLTRILKNGCRPKTRAWEGDEKGNRFIYENRNEMCYKNRCLN